MKPHSGAVLAAVLVALLLGAARLAHLGADTPDGLSRSAGPYVDEGYKTLGPRNVAVFGRPVWHPHDDYQNWMYRSPITQQAYLWAFQTFGQRVESVRLVTIACFLLLPLAYALTVGRRHGPPLIFAGVAVLCLEPGIFFFSRLALFEVPLAVLFFLLVFAISEINEDRIVAPLALAMGVTAFSMYGIKLSAPVYGVPILAGLVLHALLRANSRQLRVTLWIAAVAAAIVGLGYLREADFLARRLDLSPTKILVRLLLNTSLTAAPAAVLGGLLCGAHMLLCAPRRALSSRYRVCLLCVAFLSPAILALFPYRPFRYYVPILPAYLLLCLEWVHLRGWRESIPDRVPGWIPPIAIAVLGVILFYACMAVNHTVLSELPIRLGDEPGLSRSALLRFAAPISLLGAIAVWRWRTSLLVPRVIRFLAIATAVAWMAHVAIWVGSFAISPSYRSAEIRSDLLEIIPSDAILVGDWAPFFALGTPLRALYLAENQNNAANVPLIRPDYLLYSDTGAGRRTLGALADVEGVSLGEAVYESEYMGLALSLHRVFLSGAGGSPASAPP